MGYNVVNLNGNGYQRVYEYRDALDVSTVATWVRRFRTPPGLSRIFESWVQATGSGGGGGDTPTRLPGMMLGAVGTTNVVAVSTYASVIWGGATDAGNVDPAMWSAADPTKVFAPVAGRYNINGTVVFQNNAAGYRHIYVRKVRASDGGTQALEWVLLPPANGNVTVIPYAIGEVLMAVGDYITIECYHAGTGASIWVGGSSGSAVTRIAMTYVAAPDGSTVPRPLSRYGAVTGQTAIAINAAASIPITFAPVPNTDYAVIVNPDAVDFTTTALSKTTSGCTVWLRNKSTTANLSPNFTWQVVHGGA